MNGETRPHRRVDDLFTFIVGLIVGALTMFAAESGRLATIETTMNVHTAVLSKLQNQVETVQNTLVQMTRGNR